MKEIIFFFKVKEIYEFVKFLMLNELFIGDNMLDGFGGKFLGV